MSVSIFLSAALLWALTPTGLAQSAAPTFAQYAVRVEKLRSVRVNPRSHRYARGYRTNLRNAAREGVNFAGHYILTTWGCGTNCSQTAVIDARDGRVFFPQELGGSIFGFCELADDAEPLVYQADSRLLVLSGFKNGDLDKPDGRCGIYYLEWTGAKFRQVGFVEKRRTDTP